MYQNFIIPYVYETQHVSGDAPPIIIRSVIGGRCKAQCA
jgi:hypothetical protein